MRNADSRADKMAERGDDSSEARELWRILSRAQSLVRRRVNVIVNAGRVNEGRVNEVRL